jgi:hypothetical protein
MTKTCRKCGHATESLVSKTPCAGGGYHQWQLPDNPEAGTPCWHCPDPVCLNPPATCGRKYGFAANTPTVITMDITPGPETKEEHIVNVGTM